MVVAMEWVSQITAIALVIVGSIWLGKYLDKRFETSFWGIVGLFLGPLIGFWQLLILTGVVSRRSKKSGRKENHRQ
jgi:F0F1-type ATP synthase assembly protein I